MSLYLKFPRDPKLIGGDKYASWWSIDENLQVHRVFVEVEGKEEAIKLWKKDVERISSTDWEAKGLKDFKII